MPASPPRRRLVLAGVFLLLVAASFRPLAQAPAGAADPDFARLVREWTTRPEFLSPLVDHLPAAAGIPSPKDVLGHHVGQPGEAHATRRHPSVSTARSPRRRRA